MKHSDLKKLTLSSAEKEGKKTSFYWPCGLFIMLMRLEPAVLIILNIPKYLSAFGQLFDLEQVI